MKSIAAWSSDALQYTFTPDAGDRVERGGGRLARESVSFHVPSGLGPAEVHPDLEALGALMIVEPFAASLQVTRPVSAPFAAVVASSLGCALGPVDPGLAGRARPAAGVAAVALGTGFAVAALSVLPRTTIPVFARRRAPTGTLPTTRYRDDATVDGCRHLATDFGFRVEVVETDLEYLREPVGFTSDWANGVPAVLLADRLSIDAVAWGVVAESAYRIGKGAFADWGRRRVRQSWAGVLAAAGLDFLDPIAGISEVAATAVLDASPFGRYEQVCVRGTVGSPCGSCWRCFRRALIVAARRGEWPGVGTLHAMLTTREIQRELAARPIANEDVIAWAMATYAGSSRLMGLLRERVCFDDDSLAWLERRYCRAADLMPTKYAAGIIDALEAVLEPMSPADERAMQAWDGARRSSHRRARQAGERLARATGYAPTNTGTIGGWFDRVLGR